MAMMTSLGKKAKRWRPHFSLRTLLVFVTLVGAYFGAWDATKRWGVPVLELPPPIDDGTIPVFGRPVPPSSPMPFFVLWTEFRVDPQRHRLIEYHRYYVWAFGPRYQVFHTERFVEPRTD